MFDTEYEMLLYRCQGTEALRWPVMVRFIKTFYQIAEFAELVQVTP